MTVVFIENVIGSHELDRAIDDARRAKNVDREFVGDAIPKPERRNRKTIKAEQDISESASAEGGVIRKSMRKVDVEPPFRQSAACRKAIHIVVCRFVNGRLGRLRWKPLDEGSDVTKLRCSQLARECGHCRSGFSVVNDIDNALAGDTGARAKVREVRRA